MNRISLPIITDLISSCKIMLHHY